MTAVRPGDVMCTLSSLRVRNSPMEVSMDKVEFVGSVTELPFGGHSADDDCPSSGGRSVLVCCSPGLD